VAETGSRGYEPGRAIRGRPAAGRTPFISGEIPVTDPRRRPPRLLCCVLFFLLVGCASLSGRQPAGGLSRIVESGELRIGMSGEQPPLTMTARSGELIGLDVALSRVLAKSMGVEARFVRLAFGELLDALEARDVDLVMSGMTITPRRTERVAFVGPYYTSGKSILTRSEPIAAIEIPEDLDSPENRLAALEGSTSEEFVRGTLPRAKLIRTKGLDEAVQKVLNGEVDALIADRETCDFAVLRHPDAGLITSTTTFTVEPMGIAVPLNEPRLANLVQAYLNALADSGALDKARTFWLKDPSWVKDLR
jgi:polar amino acid transport system substrate-binding protein